MQGAPRPHRKPLKVLLVAPQRECDAVDVIERRLHAVVDLRCGGAIGIHLRA
jgi:hypothetical protein